MLIAIKTVAFIHTNDPLFIYFDNQTNTGALAAMIEHRLGHRLIRHAVRHDTYLATLIDKIIIISDLVLPTLEGRFDLPNIRMTDHINEANDQTPFITSQSRLSRIYPRFTLYSALFSTNFQPEPYLHAGTTFISMNFNNTDNGLQRYMEAFGVDGIKCNHHSSSM